MECPAPPDSTNSSSIPSTNYRLNCVQVFLTYPQCPISPQECLDHLLRLPQAPDMWIVAQEKHQDSHHHLHVWMRRDKRFDTRNPRYFDLNDADGNVYHANCQAVRNQKAVTKYVTKENNFVTNLSEEDLQRLNSRTAKGIYISIIQMAKKGLAPEALAQLATTPQGSRDVALHLTSLQRNLSSLSPRLLNLAHQLDAFPNFSKITWDHASRTLLLTGRSNTGKTALAKALLPTALFVTHLDVLATYDPANYTGIIIDEMSLAHLPLETNIHLMDRPETRDIHVRYRTATIPRGTKMVCTSNHHPIDIFKDWSKEQIKRRVHWVEVIDLDVYQCHLND